MDSTNVNLGVLELQNCLHRPYFLGPSITSKTLGKEFKDIEREPVKNFDLYGVLVDMEVPDTAWGDVRSYENP